MSEQPPPIDYAVPSGPSTNRMVGQCVAGAVGTGLLVNGAILLVMFAAFVQGEGGGSTAWFPFVATGGGLGLLALLNYVAYRAHRNPARRGYAFGIWIGLGISLLIEGVCFSRVL